MNSDSTREMSIAEALAPLWILLLCLFFILLWLPGKISDRQEAARQTIASTVSIPVTARTALVLDSLKMQSSTAVSPGLFQLDAHEAEARGNFHLEAQIALLANGRFVMTATHAPKGWEHWSTMVTDVGNSGTYMQDGALLTMYPTHPIFRGDGSALPAGNSMSFRVMSNSTLEQVGVPEAVHLTRIEVPSETSKRGNEEQHD